MTRNRRWAGWLAAPLALALLAAPWAWAQDDAKKPKARKKAGDPAMEEPDGKPGKPAAGAKGKSAKDPKDGEATDPKEKADDGADDPQYAKKLKKLRGDIERGFKKRKTAIYVYALSERRYELDEAGPAGKIGGTAKPTYSQIVERVCKMSKERESAIEDAYKFVAEYPPFEKKAKKEKGKKNLLDLGGPPRPMREWAMLGVFDDNAKGEQLATALKDEKEREFDKLDQQQKWAREQKKRKG